MASEMINLFEDVLKNLYETNKYKIKRFKQNAGTERMANAATK